MQIVLHHDPRAAMRIVDEIRDEDWPGVARGLHGDNGQLTSDLVRTLVRPADHLDQLDHGAHADRAASRLTHRRLL